MEIWEFIKTLFNPESIINYGGLTLLLIVLFLENGAFFGFFLPGDSLMFTAGLLTATGVLDHSVTTVVISMFAAGMGGYQFGWWTGRRTGKAMMNKPDTFWFRKKHMLLADNYYKKYGGKTLIIGRFVPIVRTFAPIVAGIITCRWAGSPCTTSSAWWYGWVPSSRPATTWDRPSLASWIISVGSWCP
ncbi:MAG: VTT domain-containing protein [Flavobacteriales bacterium]|nr:VTT domain-containing protein [Flavobacteriales bacterium]